MKIIAKIFVNSFVLFGCCFAMELPVAPSSSRRPVEESMFELFVQQKERMDSLEQANKDASVQVLEASAQNAQQRINTAAAQLSVDQANRKQSADLLKRITENQGNSAQINQKLREQLVEQNQELNELRNQMRDINAGQQQLQQNVAFNTERINWMYIAGGAVAVGGGIAILALALKTKKLEADYEKLSDTVAGMKWKVDLKEYATSQKGADTPSVANKPSTKEFNGEQNKKDVAELVKDINKIQCELQSLKLRTTSKELSASTAQVDFQKKVEVVIENTNPVDENLGFLIVKDRVSRLENAVASLEKRPFVSQAGPNSSHLVLNVPHQQNPAHVHTKPIKDAKIQSW
jgi:chromosome segregation ATPase